MTIAWISLWATALLLLPGWVIWRLAGPRGMPPALEIAPAFALSMAVISLVGWSGYVLGIGFSGVRAVSIVVLALAALGLPIVLWYRRPAAGESVSPPWTLWAAVAIAVGAGLSALYSGPWLSATADTFYPPGGDSVPPGARHSTAAPSPGRSVPWTCAACRLPERSGPRP